ncbi:unnamed protein product [Discosporangium mesarthrocarpum]
MASCYGAIDAPEVAHLSYLPLRTRLRDGTAVEVDVFDERSLNGPTTLSAWCVLFFSEHEAGRALLNHVIDEGLSWPFEETMDLDGFRSYFLSHAAFVVRLCEDRQDVCGDGIKLRDPHVNNAQEYPRGAEKSSCLKIPGENQVESTPSHQSKSRGGQSLGGQGSADPTSAVSEMNQNGETAQEAPLAPLGSSPNPNPRVLGVFYVKPNFPGRCSHVCNGGFITDPAYRRRGVAKIMGRAFLRLARDLGYKASYFNLVFCANEASVRLWRGLEFQELAVIPKAGRLKGMDKLVDAIQFYYDLETLPDAKEVDLSGGTFLSAWS